MQPELDVFGLSLKTFGMCFGLAFVVAGLVVQRRLKETGRPPDWAYELVFAALVGGLLGARLYFVVANFDDVVKGDLVGGIFGGSGLVWFGGGLGGAAGVLLWAWRRGMFNLELLDTCAPALAAGYAVGRIGCQISGDGDYGVPTSLPWGMAYPHGILPTSEVVHPTPIYETIAMLLIAYGLWRARDLVRPAVLFAWYLLLSGTERFLVEFIRRNPAEVLGLTEVQVLSLVLMLAGAVWLGQLRRAGPWRRADAGGAAIAPAA